MRFAISIGLLLLIFSFNLKLYTQDQHVSQSQLFEEEQTIEMKLIADFKAIFKDKGEDPDYHGANLIYKDKSGQEVNVPLRTKVRGNFRRKNCNFPPLRLNFDSKTSKGSHFEGQNKLKLVTHCQNGSKKAEQFVLQEYLVYKTYNLLTEKSFRVRLVKVTYEDKAGKYKSITRFGFLIEDEDRMADRLGGKIIEVENLHPMQTHPNVTILLSVFQYMVGNTDWSIPGLHNIKLIKQGDDAFPLTIPYDFDWCGIVNATYAKPNPMFDIPSVKVRVYRGMCRTKEEFQQAFDIFLENREAIRSLYQNTSSLTEKSRSQALKYYDEFFEIISNPKRAKAEIIDNCRR